MKRSIYTPIVLAITLLASSTLQAAEAETSKMTDLLKSRLGFRAEVSQPLEMPAKGVYQIKFGDTYGYLVEGGRYLIRGDFIDLKNAKNYTELARRESTLDALASFNDEDMIIYPAKGERKKTITVFTDTSCG